MPSSSLPSQCIGAPIPNNTPHAVSVTLPTWEATVGYEEGEEWVVNKMHSGYPRFFIHNDIQQLCKLLESSYARDNEKCFIFPTYNIAKRCRTFIKEKAATMIPPIKPAVRILQLSSPAPVNSEEESYKIEANIAIVFFPSNLFSLVKQYWQHTGEGISSRLGEYFLSEMKDKLTAEINDKRSSSNSNISSSPHSARTSRSSRSSISTHQNNNKQESATFIEERYGRNLDLRFAKEAKKILRSRLASEYDQSYVDAESMYLYPSGMASIFNAHRSILNVSDEIDAKTIKSVCFGFPYVDTLNILRKWGAGVHFYGFGDDESLDDLELRLESGERILSLFCEFPSNPLLKTPDIIRIKQLSDKFGFYVVVDDTVGNSSNINVVPYCDIVVSSLTKIFSGDSNVMAGCLSLNKKGKYYDKLKNFMNEDYEDFFWDQDAIYLERNSRDFQERSNIMNYNAEKVLKLFQESPLISKIYYPSVTSAESKRHYDAVKKENGGYGALISIVFKDEIDAICFFNTITLSKGPSLGTNFTLVCPYAILAHFKELDEVAKWGVDPNLVRLSIGMEKTDELIKSLKEALDAAQEQHDI
jgi:cystathionine gamma-synthase